MKTAKGILALMMFIQAAANTGSATAGSILQTYSPGDRVFFVSGVSSQLNPGTEAGAAGPRQDPNEPVTRSFELKHISVEEFMKTAKIYVLDYTGTESTLILRLPRKNVKEIDALLKKLDVEKKKVRLNVYAVYAHRNTEAEASGRKTPSAVNRAPIVGIEPDASAREKKLEEMKVDLKYKNIPMQTLLLNLAEMAGLNVVFETDVNFPVTCELKGVSWTEALDSILKPVKRGYSIDGKWLRIIPLQAPQGELKKVLDELRALWNFTSYEVDGPSFLTVRENAGTAEVKLVTNRPLNLSVTNVNVKGEDIGKRTISIERLKLAGGMNFNNYTFLDSPDLSLKENGYLVAGVSGFSASEAMILVISAEIQ